MLTIEECSSHCNPRLHSIGRCSPRRGATPCTFTDRKSTRLNSSHLVISYAVFCLKNKTNHPSFMNQDILGLHPTKWVRLHNYNDPCHDTVIPHSPWATISFTLIPASCAFALALLV